MFYVFAELTNANLSIAEEFAKQPNTKIFMAGRKDVISKKKLKKIRGTSNYELKVSNDLGKDRSEMLIANKLGKKLNYNDKYVIISDTTGFDSLITLCRKNGYDISRYSISEKKIIKNKTKQDLFHENIKCNIKNEKTHILVDSENVNAINDFPTDSDFIIFCNQRNCVHYDEKKAKKIICDTTGKNSLDFQLTFFLSQIINKKDKYVICSRDTGYDSVIEEYKAQGYNIRRCDCGNCVKKTESGLSIGGRKSEKIDHDKHAKLLIGYLKQKNMCQIGKPISKEKAINSLAVLLAKTTGINYTCISNFLQKNQKLILQSKVKSVQLAKENVCEHVAFLIDRYYNLITDVLR